MRLGEAPELGGTSHSLETTKQLKELSPVAWGHCPGLRAATTPDTGGNLKGQDLSCLDPGWTLVCPHQAACPNGRDPLR